MGGTGGHFVYRSRNKRLPFLSFLLFDRCQFEVSETPDKTPARIAGMFDAIAPRYDLLNHVLSAGLDRLWRDMAVDALALPHAARVLDLCTGTADLAIAAVRRTGASVVGIDFAGEMLRLGRAKVRAAALDRGIALVR